jgi:hypothetical protein
MLPPPPSLFATHPFPTTSSFPLDPPGVGQVEVVRHAFRAHIDQWRMDQLASLSTGQSGSAKGTISPDPTMIYRTAQQHEEMSSRHLDLAYQHWMVLPPEVKRETWQLEIMRAFARETEKRKQLDMQLARVQQEANQLRAQVEKLGSCQWPREFAIFPPDMLPLSRDVARELDSKDSTISPASSRWDYENVVAKWKRVVMHDKSMGRIGVGNSNSAPGEGAGRDSNLSSSRSKALQTVTSPHNSSGTGHGHPSTANSNNQPTPPYQPHDPRPNPINGPQAKRPRLMNGDPRDPNPPERENHPTPGANTNGASKAWSPNSVQSLLVSNAGAPASTSTPPPSRFGIS